MRTRKDVSASPQIQFCDDRDINLGAIEDVLDMAMKHHLTALNPEFGELTDEERFAHIFSENDEPAFLFAIWLIGQLIGQKHAHLRDIGISIH